MSMLAEKRKKKRYNLQPRGKALYEDSNRFGTRMLEKMGWSKGKGLGPNETGNSEFVRVKYKSDSIGLGFEERDDQWTQHDNDFNGLLRSLNGSEQNSSAEEDFMPQVTGFGFRDEVDKGQDEVPKISGESLEEKSKNSKARVHYQKFTRGKDISRYSEKDLANIFGKKSLKVEKAVEKQFEEDIEEKEDIGNFGVTTVNTGTSIHDYFKTKMAMKKKIEEDQPNGYVQTSDAVLEEEIVDHEEGKSQRKKKVKRIAEGNDDQKLDKSHKNKGKSSNKKNTEFNADSESNFNNPDCSKHKVVDDAEDMTENPNDEKDKNKYLHDATLYEASEVEEKQGSARNKSKKRKKESKLEETLGNEEEHTLIENQESAVKPESKKRKKQNKIEEACENQQDEILIEDNASVVKTASKKRKAKKEKREESHENEQLGALMQDEECSVSRKNKKKKNKRNDPGNDTEDERKEELKQTNEGESEVGPEPKKKELAAPTDHGCGSVDQNNDPEFHPNEAIVPLENSKAKSKSKKNKNQEDKNQVESPLSDNINSVDTIKDSENYCVFKLSGYHAELFRYINFGSFKGSNFSEIVGYGLTKDIKLEITSKRIDTEKIQNMWSKVLNKYTYKKKQNFKIKTVKKRNVFKIL